MTDRRPPRWAELLVGLLIPETYREEHLGDLREGFARRSGAPAAARRWYVRQLVRSIGPALRLRYRLRNDHAKPHSGNHMDTLKQDLRYGLRSLIKNPMFASVATLTLALAIGVNTAIFSLVSVVIFADLPMQDAETVAIVRGVNPELEVDQGRVSVPDYLDLLERQTSFEHVSALTGDQWVLSGTTDPIRVDGYRMSANTLDAWRLPPVIGRGFAPGEDQPGAAPVVMLTHSFWLGQFGGDPGVLGSTLRLEGIEHTVIGVMNPKLEFADFSEIELWTTLELSRDGADRDSRVLFVTGRLNPGVNHEKATEEVRAIGLALAEEHPDTNIGWGLWSAPAMESLIDDDANTILSMLVLTVTFVVLIACANVANMLLARATARAREMSVRSALGAPRVRLLRQLFTESLVISFVAALLGLGFAKGLLEVLIRVSNGTEQVFLMAEMDGRVLGFTLLVSLLAPLAFGLFPALRASSASAASALREGRSADGGRTGKRARSVLVSSQIALALTLMIVSGLLVRTVYNLQARELGFDPEGLVVMELDLPVNDYPDAESRRQFYERLVGAVEEIPAVQAATMTNVIPSAGLGVFRSIEIEGRPVAEGRARPRVMFVTVAPDQFEVFGMSVMAGRGLGVQDGPDAPPVVVIANDLAEEHWPGEDPVGRRIRVGADRDGPWIQIVGVVSDVRSIADSERPAAHVYVPYAQDSRSSSYVVAKSSAALASLTGALRSTVRTLDPNLPIDRITTVRQLQYDSDAGNYALLLLFVSFAVFALFMAAIGVYGVMSYTVTQRQAEIGLRMALGAGVGSVRMMVVRQGVRLLVAGMVVGLIVAAGLAQTLQSIVFGIDPIDRMTFIGVPAVLGVVALLANYIPARRATRTDPVGALRAD